MPTILIQCNKLLGIFCSSLGVLQTIELNTMEVRNCLGFSIVKQVFIKSFIKHWNIQMSYYNLLFGDSTQHMGLLKVTLLWLHKNSAL
jgi:hypothetical protein